MKFNNKKIVPILLISSVLTTNIGLTASYAYNKDDVTNIESSAVNNYNFIETSNGFILDYEIVENEKTVYYHEEFENNKITTSKYIKDNGEFKLIEELITTLKTEKTDNETEIMKAEINNITNNTITNEVIMENTIDENTINEKAVQYHPTDKNYFFVTGHSGHSGFSSLTRAAVIAALAATVGGASAKGAAVSAIATLILDGKVSNLYYTTKTYKPINGKGKPTWKKVVKYYYDKNRTRQCGPTVYTSSTTYNK